MDGGTIQLSASDLLLATLLVAVAGGVSFALRLGLERRLALAAVRTVVQLYIIGFVLKWVFQVDTPWALVPVIAVRAPCWTPLAPCSSADC